jgi:hypothetical protein
MDACHVTVVFGEPARASLRWLSWLPLLSVIASGCVSGRPATVRIQDGRTFAAGASDSALPVRLSVTTFNVWDRPPWNNGGPSNQPMKTHSHIASEARPPQSTCL